jgi:hypothetical protein
MPPLTAPFCSPRPCAAQAHLPPQWHNRLLGLRFLSPVMFVPMCEITYRPGTQDSEMQRLSHMMETVDKVVFDCPLMDEALRLHGHGEPGAPPPGTDGRPPLPPGWQRNTPYWLGYSRLRLDAAESRRHQAREARLWLLRRTERDQLHRTKSKQEAEMEMCVVCLTNPREALSISCGHKVMCPDCAARVKMINSSCPFCRVAMREVVLSKNRSTESVGSNGDDVELTGGADGAEAAAAAAAAVVPAAAEAAAGDAAAGEAAGDAAAGGGEPGAEVEPDMGSTEVPLPPVGAPAGEGGGGGGGQPLAPSATEVGDDDEDEGARGEEEVEVPRPPPAEMAAAAAEARLSASPALGGGAAGADGCGD